MTRTDTQVTPHTIPVRNRGRWLLRKKLRAPDASIEIRSQKTVSWDLSELLDGEGERTVRFFFWKPLELNGERRPGPFGFWSRAYPISEADPEVQIPLPAEICDDPDTILELPEEERSFPYLVADLQADRFVIGPNSPPRIIFI